ncbi:MAG: phosphotransferase [Deltaproteobacteria bacterium]|nr:phosphotransferase [Deltaproteobacteria bacterium]
MKAMILAAGYGTRLQPHTNHTPKPLFPIAGRPLLDAIIRRLQQAGCRAVIVNTHHLHRQIEDFIAGQHYSLEVYTRHEPQILGTGGAVKNVADFWDNQPFMVINADIIADIDLAKVYITHCRHRPAATLVLCNDPTFNSVAVDHKNRIIGFHNQSNGRNASGKNLLTFTGVQVLEPLVLNYIPAGTPYSSIDAFKQIMADGKMLRALVVPKDQWQDVGTPQSYRQAVIDQAVPQAFKRTGSAAGGRSIDWVKLKGDGSQRQWYRLKSKQGSLILVDHGIRQTRLTSEVDSFVHLGRHLFRRGVSVPQIYFYDTFCGIVFLEDLGDDHLQQAVISTDNEQAIVRLYQSVIDQIILLSRRGAEDFDRAWTYQTPEYDQNLILEKECRYFVEAFLKDYLGFKISFEDLAPEFITLAGKTLRHPTIGFMHRDMQSRNIMIKGQGIYFIDFQGGRIGPIQYDLASLLIDPYVDLPQHIQAQLLEYAIKKLSATTSVKPIKFLACYYYCSLTRNLQILGAFAYLSRAKGKKQFEKYIPPALKSLRSNLTADDHSEFPRLIEVVDDVCRHLKS